MQPRPILATCLSTNRSRLTSRTSEIACGLWATGNRFGDFSLTIVLYACDKSIVDRLVGEFSGIFTNFDGNLFTETYNQLNAYFATVPGNYAQNLRRLYLLNSNYADLSFSLYPAGRKDELASACNISRRLKPTTRRLTF